MRACEKVSEVAAKIGLKYSLNDWRITIWVLKDLTYSYSFRSEFLGGGLIGQQAILWSLNVQLLWLPWIESKEVGSSAGKSALAESKTLHRIQLRFLTCQSQIGLRYLYSKTVSPQLSMPASVFKIYFIRIGSDDRYRQIRIVIFCSGYLPGDQSFLCRHRRFMWPAYIINELRS